MFDPWSEATLRDEWSVSSHCWVLVKELSLSYHNGDLEEIVWFLYYGI